MLLIQETQGCSLKLALRESMYWQPPENKEDEKTKQKTSISKTSIGGDGLKFNLLRDMQSLRKKPINFRDLHLGAFAVHNIPPHKNKKQEDNIPPEGKNNDIT